MYYLNSDIVPHFHHSLESLFGIFAPKIAFGNLITLLFIINIIYFFTLCKLHILYNEFKLQIYIYISNISIFFFIMCIQKSNFFFFKISIILLAILLPTTTTIKKKK